MKDLDKKIEDFIYKSLFQYLDYDLESDDIMDIKEHLKEFIESCQK